MKTFLVTGAANGIGRAVVLALAERGDLAVLNDLTDSAALTSLVRQLEQAGVESRVVLGDVSAPETARQAFDGLPRLDVLVNNAGIAGPTAKVEDTDLAAWDQTIAVNLTGPFLCTRRAVPLLKSAGGGAIVNISSAAGRLGFPLRTPYSASKFGVIGLTESWAMELGPDKIRVNAILPGIVAGERQERVIAAKAASYGIEHEAMRERLLSKVSMRQMVTAQDIANQIIFICSPAGAAISGQSLSVCGNVEHLG